jgi:hypothetical protein
MSVQTLNPPAMSPAVAYVEHLRHLAAAGKAIKPSAEVVRTVLVKAGLREALVRVLSGPSVTYVHLAPGTDRSAVVALLEPLWTEQTGYGTTARIQRGVNMISIRREGWENTRPAGSDHVAEPLMSFGMTERQLFDIADVLDAALATRRAGILWTVSELVSALSMRHDGEVPATAATLEWMVRHGFVVRLKLRRRTLFLRQHVAV